MSLEQAFEITKEFFETKPAVASALQHLESGSEIKVLLDNRLEASLCYKSGKVSFEKRIAENPDVEFTLLTEAVRLFSSHPGESVGELGVDILKLIAAGHINVRVVGSSWNVINGGYLKIVKEAGPEFTGFLASHGLRSLTKIMALIRNLKN